MRKLQLIILKNTMNKTFLMIKYQKNIKSYMINFFRKGEIIKC